MRKETIIAIVMGILLGVGIGFVVLFQSRKGDEAKVIPVSGDTENTKIVKTARPPGQEVLEITEPKDKTITDTNKVTIKGTASKDSLVVIQTPITNTVLKSETANFSASIPLALGENTISVSVYKDSGTPQEVTLQIYYVK
jgi:hypothetical protein